MTYLPKNLPFPNPSLDAEEFWRHCNQHRLMFQRCSFCAIMRHPPTPYCGNCHSNNFEWIQAPSSGSIFSYTIVYKASHKGIINSVPYNIVLVEFPKFSDVRLVSNVIDVEPNALAIGREVFLVWETGPAEQQIPRFKIKRE